MLNLSDKDLDRLSQEAAQQYEPTDVDPKLWEKLEVRLDRDLGKVKPNPGNGIGRLPFYYAPAMLVILGIGYYFIRHHKSNGLSPGSPPFALVQQPPDQKAAPSSPPKNSNTDKKNSTSASSSNTVTYPNAGARGATTATTDVAKGAGSTPSSNGGSNASTTAATGVTDIGTFDDANRGLRSGNHGHHKSSRRSGIPDATKLSLTSDAADDASTLPASKAGNNHSARAGLAAEARKPRGMNFSSVGRPVRLTNRPYIDDSALRAVDAASIRPPINRRGGLHINRSLVFGIHGAADFASVQSIAGDRAGSTFGLTVDYQFASHAYIGSGLFYSRKIFSAAPEDYHVSSSYYMNHNMGMGDHVKLIKGSFDMLEVPLNLRYDFSSGDNALFFLSAGTSSYFFTRENCGYYYMLLNNPEYQKFSYSTGSSLFSTFNLSAGGEFGISNSLSVLIAPYIKIPTRNLGFGQVQLTSFGIDFALRFAPVISRRR